MSGKANPPKILLVDDEKDITTVLKANLELQGFSIDAFNEPQHAISNYKSQHYDGIVLDIKMPGISGFELARAIWDKDPDARICFLTAFEIYQREAEKVFPNFKQHCFLKKPMPAKNLAEHLKNHILIC